MDVLADIRLCWHTELIQGVLWVASLSIIHLSSLLLHGQGQLHVC
jgi:hypothetical protein